MWGRKKNEQGGPPFSQLADNIGGLALEPAFPSSSFPSTPLGGGGLDAAPPSLRETVKKRLLNDMIRNFAGEAAGVVMLVDSFTVRILSSVCKMSELLDENIHLVENITMKAPKAPNGEYLRRQAMPALTAVYFITPTVESVNRFIADYRDKKQPMYGACHLFFTSRLSDALLGKIKASSAIGRVAGFKEINIELACTESHAFIFDSPHSLSTLFAPEENPAATEAKVQEQHRLAANIATLCVTLGELPHVRHANRPVATSVASILQNKLDELARSGIGFPSRVQSDAERPTLLVLDRSCDPLSPLLHEFTYQAMVHDLLPVQEERYRYHYVGNKNQPLDKEVLLNDTDSLWARLRHLHIADLGQLLHTEYTQFVADHPEAAKLTKAGGEKDLKAMTEGLRGMPKFQEQSSRYSLHMSITEELMKKYRLRELDRVALLEQAMATGEDAQGRAYRSALADLRSLLEQGDLPLSPEDKIRLLMIYLITQEGIKQDERRQLIQLAGISPEDQVAILNLFYLNVTLVQGTAGKKKPPQQKKASQGADSSYEVSRYAPPLKRSVEESLTVGLPASEFPFVRPPAALSGSAGAGNGNSARGAKGGGGGVPATGRRLIVIMLGGASYSELRSMHELSRAHGREILFGATAMLTPQTYLLALKDMKQLEALV